MSDSVVIEFLASAVSAATKGTFDAEKFSTSTNSSTTLRRYLEDGRYEPSIRSSNFRNNHPIVVYIFYFL
jgi:hypothetical protein